MRILIACEFSGTVRDAFRRRGQEAWSCDIMPTDADPQFHLECKVEEIINEGWDLMVAHPSCKYLSVSGIHWNDRGWEETDKALEFVRWLMAAPVTRIAIENPVSIISSRIRKPDQVIQPYEFGHDASKKTCLWLKNLPPLVPTDYVPPRMVDGKPRRGNQTDGGQNKLAPSLDRWKLRSKTYAGIAEAMAEAWGKY